MCAVEFERWFDQEAARVGTLWFYPQNGILFQAELFHVRHTYRCVGPVCFTPLGLERETETRKSYEPPLS